MKTTTKIALCLIIIISFFMSIYIINVVAKEEKKDTCKCKEEKYEYKKNENIVFFGDSITEWYPLDVFFEDAPYVNSGVAGDTTKDLLENIESRVYNYNPTKVFILIGTNDYKENMTSKDISNNIKKIVQEIKKNRSNAKIYVQSIYPINNSDDSKINKNNVEPRTNSEISNTNKLIKELCNKEKVTYIDVYSELIADDGALDLRYTKDGLHLNDLGYYVVTKKLISYIEE